MLLRLAGVFHLASIATLTHVVSVLTSTSASCRFCAITAAGRWCHASSPCWASSLFIGVALGALLLNWLSDGPRLCLRLLLGLTIASSLVVSLLPTEPTRTGCQARWTFGAVGLMGGVLGGMFSTGGTAHGLPPVPAAPAGRGARLP